MSEKNQEAKRVDDAQPVEELDDEQLDNVAGGTKRNVGVSEIVVTKSTDSSSTNLM